MDEYNQLKKYLIDKEKENSNIKAELSMMKQKVLLEDKDLNLSSLKTLDHEYSKFGMLYNNLSNNEKNNDDDNNVLGELSSKSKPNYLDFGRNIEDKAKFSFKNSNSSIIVNLL